MEPHAPPARPRPIPVVSSDPGLTEFEVAHHHHRGRRARIIRRTHIWLIGMFVAFRVADALAFSCYFGPESPVSRKILASVIFTSGIWTTVLLVSIWLRQVWARYALATLLVLGVLALGVWLPGSVNSLPLPVIAKLGGVGVIGGLAAWVLIANHSIRRYFSTNLI